MKIKIAVAIDSAGHWYARGADDIPDLTAQTEVAEIVDDIGTSGPRSLVWIEAEVPLPTTQTIRGERAEGVA